MIRSREHGYLFVQLPHTGCSSVATELMELYDGEKLLGKHATFNEFRRRVSDWTPRYVFSTVRHPLDDIVSTYEKLRTNHEQYDDPGRSTDAPGGFVDAKARERFHFVAEGSGFDAFVRRYYRMPFDNWASLDHRNFNRVMRFETLVEDFDAVLRELGLEPVRSLPRRNATSRGRSSWQDYWESAELQAFIAPRVAPFMADWGYDFPESWDQPNPMAVRTNQMIRRALLVRRERIWSRDAPVFAGD